MRSVAGDAGHAVCPATAAATTRRSGTGAAPMTVTIQVIVLLLAVLAGVAVLARRLNTAPSILLVIVGVVLALIPGLPRGSARAGIRPAGPAAADHLRGRRLDELARVPLQPPADRAAGVRMRDVHHLRGRGRGPLAVRLAVGGGLPAGRHRRAAGCRRAADAGADAQRAAAAARRSRGRRPRQ